MKCETAVLVLREPELHVESSLEVLPSPEKEGYMFLEWLFCAFPKVHLEAENSLAADPPSPRIPGNLQALPCLGCKTLVRPRLASVTCSCFEQTCSTAYSCQQSQVKDRQLCKASVLELLGIRLRVFDVRSVGLHRCVTYGETSSMHHNRDAQLGSSSVWMTSEF